MPALCSRNTNDAAEPSRIGTSSAVMSTTRLSRPSPAQAESRCSTVFTFGPSGLPSAESVVAMRVSQTLSAAALMTTGRGRSTRRKTMPESAGAGRSVSSTFWPPCTPTPTARVIDLSVRCASIAELSLDRRAAPAREGMARRDGGLTLSPPACAGTPGSRSRPCRCSPARRPWPPRCGRCARRSASSGRCSRASARGICTCWFRIGRLSVPVRCTGTLLTTCTGGCIARRAGLRPVAITVTRSWSPSDSSYAVP